ncbi:ribonuclease p protein subunit p29 [Quercus suber]|uniref:Ribonuclease p protein subunit p29 n=1 Tax=Quercus suber TaxID=58331 RepID=A0AAW0KKE3_QUESU
MATETAIQDPRKHALEALKRRFAFVEADLLQQKNKKSKNEDGKEPHRTTSLADKTDAAVTPSFDAQHKKDPEENAPAYLQLSQAVHENLLATNIKLLGSRLPGIVQLSSRKGDMVDKILHELLQNGDTAQKYMQKSRKINIDHFVLLDNYVQGRGICTGSHIRALRMHSKRSKKHMSMKQHKKCGSFDLPQELHKYDVFRPMHEMWKGYMMQLLKTVGKNQLAQCLLNADLHGAFILVELQACNLHCSSCLNWYHDFILLSSWVKPRYDVFRPMHEMWKGYMMQLLKTIGKNQLAQCLLNADLHGAFILVAECKATSFTGVSGIMIRETAETFGIITQDDVFRETQNLFRSNFDGATGKHKMCINISAGPIQRFVKIKSYENVESSGEEFTMSYPILSFLRGDGS